MLAPGLTMQSSVSARQHISYVRPSICVIKVKGHPFLI